MDIKKLKEKNLQASVDLGDGVEVDLRYISPKELSSLRKQATKKIPKGYQVKEELDDDRFRQLMVDAAVSGWRGINDDGEPFECTSENRKMLIDEWSDLRLLVFDVAPDYQKMIEHAGKNSEAISAQS